MIEGFLIFGGFTPVDVDALLPYLFLMYSLWTFDTTGAHGRLRRRLANFKKLRRAPARAFPLKACPWTTTVLPRSLGRNENTAEPKAWKWTMSQSGSTSCLTDEKNEAESFWSDLEFIAGTVFIFMPR